MSKAAKLKKKRVEDVLGGEEAWKNAPRSQSALPPDFLAYSTANRCLA